MAHPDRQPDTVLIAHVTAHLVSGETFDLLPFTDAEDVKSEVTDLIDSWSKSGFLLRGRYFYPWHQVARIEITSVEEISRSESEQQLIDWEINDQYRLQQNFWKTKKPREKKEEPKEGGNQAQPHAAG
ncbi:MAG TPA: hypothetical protein VKX41_03190 [Alloacidobacterium sp.]|jgi:hypothetical protein|nr:hypothetical protein [Alloacidobacterium sp.]